MQINAHMDTYIYNSRTVGCKIHRAASGEQPWSEYVTVTEKGIKCIAIFF